MKAARLKVQILARTWARDSNGLFDFESKNVLRNSFVTSVSSRLLRLGNDVLLRQGDNEQTEMVASLAWLVRCEGYFLVKEDTAERIWRVVPSVKAIKPGQGQVLTEGEVLRIGRVCFCVKQVCASGEDSPVFIQKAKRMPSPNENEVQACRICLSEEQSPDNPLISPCKCSGTMRFIHLQCLREWLQSRLNVKQSGSIISYHWKALDCELCKTNLPSQLVLDGKTLELMDVHKPNTPFLVLEEMARGTEDELGIHVLSMPAGAQINLGRGHESDIRVQDISVSRLHASIHLENGTFRVSDRKSKFGTLVQVKRSAALHPGSTTTLQVGRTVLTLKVKKQFRLADLCCFSRSVHPVLVQPEKHYEDRTDQDGSFTRLVPPPPGPRLIAQDFAEEERPTTRARTLGEGSLVLRDLNHVSLAS